MRKVIVVLSMVLGLLMGCTLEAQRPTPPVYGRYGNVMVYRVSYQCYLAVSPAKRVDVADFIALACH